MLLLVLIGPTLGGCAAVRVTDPPRTATEQFLLSEAASRAVQQLSAAALRDRQVYIEDRFFASIDKPLVIGELRSHLLLNGVRLAESREEGQIVLEVRTHGVGVDRYDYLLGLPPVLIPAGGTGVDEVATGSIVTPELAILKNTRQRSFASVAFVAYWGDTGEVVASSGPFLGQAEREDWWFFGVGPRTTGDIPPVEPEE
ncbi:DUF6655 family protein [Phycisphaerales bacterium AB-hyl4]|uniref:DUF6655 family protein n=1 Tax=Natronomicrosphaera hydrolytica TaxID=3242702 RepID=A0ABV4U280_9BACT